MWPIFKIEMFIYQLKAKLDGEIWFGKITKISDPALSKMLVRGLCGKEYSAFYSGP